MEVEARLTLTLPHIAIKGVEVVITTSALRIGRNYRLIS